MKRAAWSDFFLNPTATYRMSRVEMLASVIEHLRAAGVALANDKEFEEFDGGRQRWIRMVEDHDEEHGKSS